MKGNPAKTTIILSFPGESRILSMLRYALFSVLISNSIATDLVPLAFAISSPSLSPLASCHSPLTSHLHW